MCKRRKLDKMANIRVNKTREPVTGYDKTLYEAMFENKEFGWKVRFTENQLDDLREKLTEKINERHEYIHILYEVVWSRMKHVAPKLEPFHPDMLKDTDEALIAICDEIIKSLELDKIKPTQKTIDETADKAFEDDMKKKNSTTKKKK